MDPCRCGADVDGEAHRPRRGVARLDADVVKISTMANEPHDNVRMLQLIRNSTIPTVGIGAGALRIVYEVAQVVDIPVVAIGGITGLDDVLDYLAAGAVAVQVGTAIFK